MGGEEPSNLLSICLYQVDIIVVVEAHVQPRQVQYDLLSVLPLYSFVYGRFGLSVEGKEIVKWKR